MYLKINFDSHRLGIISAALWRHMTAAWCSPEEVGGTPIIVHGVAPIFLIAMAFHMPLLIVSQSTGECHSLRVSSVVVLANMICDSCRVHFGDRVLLSCPCELYLLWRSYISFVFLFPHFISPLSLTSIHTRAILTKNLVHHPCVLLCYTKLLVMWLHRAFSYTGDDFRSLGIKINLQIKPQIYVLRKWI